MCLPFRSACGSLLAVLLVVGSLMSRPARAGTDMPQAGKVWKAILEACLEDEYCAPHLEKAAKYSESGNWDRAIYEYQAAYDRHPYPPFMYNIGRLYHKHGQLKKAVEAYQVYLNAQPSEDREQQTKAQEYMGQALRELSSGPMDSGRRISPYSSDLLGRPTPVYKKWWFWTAIGGGVATIVIIGAVAGTVGRGE